MKNIILLLIIFVIFANCSLKNKVNHHGVHKLELKKDKIFVNKTNKNDIITLLGIPSTKSQFDNEVLIFIERKTSSGTLFKAGTHKILKNNILILEIDSYGLVSKKTFYDKNKMNKIKFSSNQTGTDYTKSSFVYDFLSSMRQKVNDPLGRRKNKN